MKIKLAIIGQISYDKITTYKNEIAEVISGTAYITGVGASKFSRSVGLVSRIGNDFSIENLKKLGVCIEGIKQIKNGKTSRFALRYTTNSDVGREVTFNYNVGKDICPIDIPNKYLDAEIIYVSNLHPFQQAEFIRYLKRKSKATLAIDTMEDYLFQETEKVISNYHQCTIGFVDKSMNEIIKTVTEKTNKILVVKKGKDGADYISDNLIFSHKAPRVSQIVDKTGSGDILAGALLAQLSEKKKPQKSLENAVVFASQSITAFGVHHLLDN